jgi:hypothetical protein
MIVIAAGLTGGGLLGSGAAPALADTVCTGDFCLIYSDSVQTPLGLVTVSATDSNVVTVHLAPTASNTLVYGIPFAVPPGPPCRIGRSVAVPPGPPCHTVTTIVSTGGLVVIDTVQSPPHSILPNLAIISIHPPGPCTVSTTGTTVVFTPISVTGTSG